LAFALGLNVSFARIATALNDNLSPWLAQLYQVPISGWIGVAACLLSCVSSLVVIYLDSESNRIAAGVGTLSDYTAIVESPLQEDTVEDEEYDVFVDASSQLATPIEESTVVDPTGYDSEEFDEEDESIHWSLAFKFNASFWLLFCITITLYGSVQPFFHICTDVSLLFVLMHIVFSDEMVSKRPRSSRICHVYSRYYLGHWYTLFRHYCGSVRSPHFFDDCVWIINSGFDGSVLFF
jgi:hypothetical protein